MLNSGMFLMSLFIALVALSLLVIIHEAGHFIVARICGVNVTEFSVGFGQKMLSVVDKKGTQWNVRSLPFGGFVALDESFSKASVLVKVCVAFAGPLFNVVSAFLMCTVLLLVSPQSVGSQKGSNGVKVMNVRMSDGVKVSDDVKSNDIVEMYTITQAMQRSFLLIKQYIRGFFTVFKVIAKQGMSKISGPVGILKSLVNTDSLGQLVMLMVQLSVSLAMFNLLPFPGLDGGQIIVSVLNLSSKWIQVWSIGGLVIIGGLFVFITFQDVWKMWF